MKNLILKETEWKNLLSHSALCVLSWFYNNYALLEYSERRVGNQSNVDHDPRLLNMIAQSETE